MIVKRLRIGRVLCFVLSVGACSGSDGAGPDIGGGDTADPSIVDAVDFDWTATFVDNGIKPHIGLRQDLPIIAYMREAMGSAGWIRVVEGTAQGLGAPETLQSGYHYGPIDVAVSASGSVAVAYHNHDWEDAAVALNTGGGWSISRIADQGHDGWDPAVAFAPDGLIHVVGIDPSQFGATQSMEHAQVSVTGAAGGDAWDVESLGAGAQPYEWGTDLAIDSQGVLHAVYFDHGSKDLIYATSDGAGWTLTAIYEQGDAGRFPVIAVDEDDEPHVAFFQTDGAVNESGTVPGNIVYGSHGGGAWSFQTVGTVDEHVLGMTAARRTVALSLTPTTSYVAFIDTAKLQMARITGTQVLTTRIVEAGDEPLLVVSMAVDSQDRPHLVYSTVPSLSEGNSGGERVWYLVGTAR